MLSTQPFFESITQQLRQLICCDAALLVLDCPVPELRHPLLPLFPTTMPITTRVFEAGRLASLLGDEYVRAACDIACQRGEIVHFSLVEERARYIAVAPLSGIAGILGYVLLTNAVDFTRGEASLLRSFIEDLMPDLETAVRALLLSRLVQAVKSKDLPPDDEQEQQRLSEMLNSIALVGHELRSPLAAIKGYAGLLQTYSVSDIQQEPQEQQAALAILTPARQQHYLDMILDETQRLEELIADLLDASRMQSGRLVIRCHPVDVVEACQRAVQRARQQIDRLSHARPQLECAFAPCLPPIKADASRIQTILNNVLDNAIKYSPQGGTIKLTVGVTPAESERTGGPQSIKIVVRDQGIGIPPDQLPRLFQPFSRIDHPQLRQVQGVGLGLYITRQLIEAMGGTIDMSSQPGVGTSITLNFSALSQRLIDNASSYVLPVELLSSLR